MFGIDYGSNLAKVAVYDRKSARPSLLLNREDGNVPYWHTAVAYDKLTKKLVAGKKAKAIVRALLILFPQWDFRCVQSCLTAFCPLSSVLLTCLVLYLPI